MRKHEIVKGVRNQILEKASNLFKDNMFANMDAQKKPFSMYSMVKFRCSEKVTKIWKKSPTLFWRY